MKIKEVTTHNFKSISQDCILSVDTKITPLVGASETGKTNILEALNKFFAPTAFDETDLCTFSETEIGDESYMVSVTFKLEDFDKEEIAKINERITEVGELTLRKQRNGQYVLDESGLREREPKEPQPPSRLTELHNIIWENLVNADNQVTEFYHSLPDEVANSKQYQVARQGLQAWMEYMKSSGPSPLPSEAEERDFLTVSQNSADNFSAQVQQLPNVPAQLVETANSLRGMIGEAITLSYEVPQEQEVDPNRLLELCPRALYIRDTDVQLLPDSIPISELEADTEQTSTYQILLRIAGLKPKDLRDTDVTRRDRKLGNGAERVNKLLERWTQEKLEGRFSVDPDNLLFHITGKEGHFGKVSDRSEGFRWFLSFCLSYGLPANTTRTSILLLDEPGLHLHASAQKDLLELFESVANSCQIIYTTHSPFMINKNYPERIRAVFKKQRPLGTSIDNKPYHPTKGGYYEPIRTSIGLTLGNSLFIGGCNLIVEGIADQIILTAFSRHLAKQDKPFINLQDICITPAGGANNVPYFAYLCNVEDMKPVALLDNDTEGDNAFTRIEKEGILPTDRVARVHDAVTKSKETIIELEDLIDREFYHTAFLDAYKELPKLEFVKKLPKTYQEVTEQLAESRAQGLEKKTEGELDNADMSAQKATLKAGSGKQVKEHRGEPKGTTVTYSQLFKDKQWGSFDKTLVARKVSQRLEDMDIPDAKDSTMSNFKRLFDIINNKFK